MRSALHFGSGMSGSYAGIFSEKSTRNIKGQISGKLPGCWAEIGRVGGVSPVGPTLAFVAKKEKENLFLWPLEYLRLQFGFSEN